MKNNNITIKNPERLLELGNTIINLIPREAQDELIYTKDAILALLEYKVCNVGKQGKHLPLHKKYHNGKYIPIKYSNRPVNSFVDVRKHEYIITNVPKGFINFDCPEHGPLMCMRRLRSHQALLIVLTKNKPKLRQVFAFPFDEFTQQEVETLVGVSDTITVRKRKTKTMSTLVRTLGSELTKMYTILPIGKNNAQFWTIKEKEKEYILKAAEEAENQKKTVSQLTDDNFGQTVFIIAY